MACASSCLNMIDIAFLKLAHLLCLVYWLGGGLGVFYSSFLVVDEKRSRETRLAAAKMLFTLDLAPRLCMPLILGLGVSLARKLGFFQAPGELILVTWLLVVGWMALVLILHFKHSGRIVHILAPVDFWFRGVFIVIVAGLSLYSWLGSGDLMTDWMAWKLLLFVFTVFCGLMIRFRLRPFGPAFGRLKQGAHDAADDQAIRQSIAGTRPFALAIWVALILEAALGVHLI